MFAVGIASVFAWNFQDPPWFWWAWIAGTVLFFAGWLLFLWNVWHNVRVPRGKRALWTTVLFFAGPYTMPFYFWFYIR